MTNPKREKWHKPQVKPVIGQFDEASPEGAKESWARTPRRGLQRRIDKTIGLDRRGYLGGLRSFTVGEPSEGYGYYTPSHDALRASQFHTGPSFKPYRGFEFTTLHEAAHRGQKVLPEDFAAFRKAKLKGPAGMSPEEVFANSYASYLLGHEMPEHLNRFWDQRFNVGRADGGQPKRRADR